MRLFNLLFVLAAVIVCLSPVSVHAQGSAGGQAVPAQSAGQSNGGPRLGRYNMYAYNPRQFLVGWFELLPDGKYRTKAGGTGTYSFGPDGIKWLSGPHQEQSFIGEFREDRGGKTHRIVMKKTDGGKEMMIAFNSVE